jgi:hypothetical protein
MSTDLEDFDYLMAYSDVDWRTADQVKDFGYTIPGVRYMRQEPTEMSPLHLYASYIFAQDGRFLELVLESYKGVKNTRDKNQKPVELKIVRDKATAFGGYL